MATPAALPIDYTDKDYASLRRALLELARLRLPEWTDHSPGDLGVLLVDLFAYMGDVVLYYQDRIAAESFLHTASERRSVLHLLRLIGYELRPPAPAAADLQLTFRPPVGPALVNIPHGAQFAARGSGAAELVFEYLGPPLIVDLDSDQVRRVNGKRVYDGLPVTHSTSHATEVLGSSRGEANQVYALPRAPVILESLVVEVHEGGPGWVRWDRREGLITHPGPGGRAQISTPESRHYYVQFDEEDRARLHFGDGIYGRRPPAGLGNVRATYRVGGGVAGNVPAGAIQRARTPLGPLLESVTNPRPAAGGADHEPVAEAVRLGPMAFRSGARAVTLDDYLAQAYRAGGVAKARARAHGWNQVDLYVAPEGDSCRPVPEDLRRRLISFFEDRRMAGTFVEVRDATCVEISVGLEVLYEGRYHPDAVRQAVTEAVAQVLAFRHVDFGQPVYLSDIYARVEAVPGVQAVTITRFRRALPATGAALEAQLRASGLPPLADLPEFVRRGLTLEVAADGRIDVGEFELAALGALDVRMREAPR